MYPLPGIVYFAERGNVVARWRGMSLAVLPEKLYSIGLEFGVGGDEGPLAVQGTADEESIKRVAMVKGQRLKPGNVRI